MTFPDALDRASRTIVTGEGGTSPIEVQARREVQAHQGPDGPAGVDQPFSEQRGEGEATDGQVILAQETHPGGAGEAEWFPDNHTELADRREEGVLHGQRLGVCKSLKSRSAED